MNVFAAIHVLIFYQRFLWCASVFHSPTFLFQSLKITNTDDFSELIITQAVAPVGLRERAAQMVERHAVQTRLDEWMDGDS